jgi:hypothetical protein
MQAPQQQQQPFVLQPPPPRPEQDISGTPLMQILKQPMILASNITTYWECQMHIETNIGHWGGELKVSEPYIGDHRFAKGFDTKGLTQGQMEYLERKLIEIFDSRLDRLNVPGRFIWKSRRGSLKELCDMLHEPDPEIDMEIDCEEIDYEYLSESIGLIEVRPDARIYCQMLELVEDEIMEMHIAFEMERAIEAMQKTDQWCIVSPELYTREHHVWSDETNAIASKYAACLLKLGERLVGFAGINVRRPPGIREPSACGPIIRVSCDTTPDYVPTVKLHFEGDHFIAMDAKPRQEFHYPSNRFPDSVDTQEIFAGFDRWMVRYKVSQLLREPKSPEAAQKSSVFRAYQGSPLYERFIATILVKYLDA